MSARRRKRQWAGSALPGWAADSGAEARPTIPEFLNTWPTKKYLFNFFAKTSFHIPMQPFIFFSNHGDYILNKKGIQTRKNKYSLVPCAMQVWGNTKKHRLYYVPCVVVFKLKHYPLKAVNKDYESDVRLQQRLSLNSIPVRSFFFSLPNIRNYY